MIGGFSRAVDLIQSEYGWLDEVVLDLAVGRLRQIVANIEDRQKALRNAEVARVEWSTRTISTFVAATVPVEKGKQNQLLKAAEKIKLNMSSDAEETDAPDNAPAEVYVEEGSQVAKNNIGSFEALTAGFGGAR